MPKTPIGRLNQRATIERAVLTPDGHGGNVTTWALRAVVWALVEPITGREALMAVQVTAVLNTGVTIWFRNDISVKDRLRIGARVLQVESYQDPDGTKDELRLLCSEAQA